jgi:hypothetical protein
LWSDEYLIGLLDEAVVVLRVSPQIGMIQFGFGEVLFPYLFEGRTFGYFE